MKRIPIVFWLLMAFLLFGDATGRRAVEAGDGRIGKQVFIPAGTYFVGDDGETDNHPCRPRRFSAFSIDVHPVTQAQYARFIRESGYTPRGNFSAPETSEEALLPAVNLTFDDAVAYARFQGRRLPSEWEWEIAARSLKRENLFATRGTPSLSNGNFFRFKQKNGITPVFSYPANGLGLYGMAGNVFEWTASRYERRRLRGKHASRFRLMVLRGGAWTNLHQDARTTKRTPFPAERCLPWLGFRCVADAAADTGDRS